MGIGSALGAASAGYAAESQRLENNKNRQGALEQGERRMRMDEESSRLRNATLKQKTAEYYSPSNKAARAAQAKVDTAKALMTAKITSDFLTPDDNLSTLAIKEANKAKEMVMDQQAVTKTDRAFDGVYQEIGASGTVSDYKSINELISTDEVLAGMVKEPLVRYNPNEQNHQKGVDAYTVKYAQMTGMSFDQALPIVEGMADAGLVGFGAGSGKPWDITGIGSIVGADKRQPAYKLNSAKAQIEKGAQASIAKQMEKRKQEKLTPDIPEWHQGRGEEGKQLYKGKDPSQYAYMLKLNGLPIPPDLAEMAKTNSKGSQGYWDGATPEQFQGKMDEFKDMALSGELDEKGIAIYKSGIENLKDSKERETARKLLRSAEDHLEVQEIFKKDNVTTSDKNTMQSIETNSISSNKDLMKERKLVKASEAMIFGLNDVMSDLEKAVNGEGVMSGVGSDFLVKLVAKDIESVRAGINLFKSGKDVTRQQVLNTLGLNTKIGKLVASYVKETSGAAVSDQERAFLTGILAGAMNGDPKAMATSMSAFRDVTANELENKANDFLLVDKLPYTMYNVKGIANQVDYVSKIGAQKSTMLPGEDKAPEPTKVKQPEFF